MVEPTSITPSSSHTPTLPAAASLYQAFLLWVMACLLSNSSLSPSSLLLPLRRHNCLLDYTETWIRELSWKATQELERGKDKNPAGSDPWPDPWFVTETQEFMCQKGVKANSKEQGRCNHGWKKDSSTPPFPKPKGSLLLSCLGSFSAAKYTSYTLALG